MATRSFPLTVDQVMKYAWSIDKRGEGKFGMNGPSQGWWLSFRKRYPNVCKLRKPDIIDRGRSIYNTVRVLRQFYQVLKKTLDDYNLEERPMDIYNCDETIVDLNKATTKVVVPKSFKKAHSRAVASSEHVSILCCVNADGNSLPPLIIFKKSNPGGKYSAGGVEGAMYTCQATGFMDGEIFLKWLLNLFIPRTRPTAERPVLLLLDGHASHTTIDVIDCARNNHVLLLALAPHTTHLCQPLDVAVFKSELSKTVKLCQLVKGDLWVPKSRIPAMIREPFDNSMTRTNIKSGFRKCGIFPYDPNAIDKTQLRHVGQDIDLSIPHPESETEVAESDQGVNDAAEQNPYFPDGNEDLPSLENEDLLSLENEDLLSLENELDSPRQNPFIRFSVTTGLPARSKTKFNYPEEEISVSGNKCFKNITMSMKALEISENLPISETSEVSMQIETSDDHEFNPLEASFSSLCSYSCFSSNQPSIEDRPSTSNLPTASTSLQTSTSLCSSSLGSSPSVFKLPVIRSALDTNNSPANPAQTRFARLVKENQIPARLQDVLFPPDKHIPANRKRPLRCRSGGQLLTSQVICDDIDQQIEELERKEQAKTARKRQRHVAANSEAASTSSEPAPTRRSIRKPKKSTRNREEEEDDDCYICVREFSSCSRQAQKRWVGCETVGCPHWVCPACLPESIDYSEDYYCEACT